ncbi:MAG: hypothetical protein ACFFBD_04830 [Candidatus Hodarchaeota archaeon]
MPLVGRLLAWHNADDLRLLGQPGCALPHGLTVAQSHEPGTQASQWGCLGRSPTTMLNCFPFNRVDNCQENMTQRSTY